MLLRRSNPLVACLAIEKARSRVPRLLQGLVRVMGGHAARGQEVAVSAVCGRQRVEPFSADRHDAASRTVGEWR